MEHRHSLSPKTEALRRAGVDGTAEQACFCCLALPEHLGGGEGSSGPGAPDSTLGDQTDSYVRVYCQEVSLMKKQYLVKFI